MKVKYTNGLAPDDFLRVFTNGGASYLQFPPFPEVRILTHLHGGFVAGDDDGNPFAQPDAFRSGATQSVTYPNEQPATLLWYHDHYLGDTRMNVVAGLAGGYLLRDSFDTGSNPLLPGPIGTYELVMVVQDRQFNPDGSLLYPVAPASTHGPWIGEYFGDVMLVNGKIWPKLTVRAGGVPVPGAQRLQRPDPGSADLHGRRPARPCRWSSSAPRAGCCR